MTTQNASELGKEGAKYIPGTRYIEVRIRAQVMHGLGSTDQGLILLLLQK